MKQKFWDYVAQMNVADPEERLAAARRLSGEPPERAVTEEVNNHVHTTFSFSPYSPTASVWAAREEGLSTVGIVDHDSVAGAREFRRAGDALGLPTTTGFEIRVSFADGPFAERRINSPDAEGMAYIVCHALPHTKIEEADAFLQPIRAAREARNERMVDELNRVLEPTGLPRISYAADVRPTSEVEQGGTVTERHIMFALATRVIDQVGTGPALVEFLESRLGLSVPSSRAKVLSDAENPHLAYDLLGVLKSELVPRVFEVPGSEECIPIWEAVDAMRSFGAIPSYSYLGDITESVTGDKKAQKFEDDYLDELIPELVRLGFQAVTYMPPRNTRAQLERLQNLCREHGLLEISGVDVNASRQSFSCPETTEPAFRHLGDAAWALIEHERAVEDGNPGLFADGRHSGVAEVAARGRGRFA